MRQRRTNKKLRLRFYSNVRHKKSLGNSLQSIGTYWLNYFFKFADTHKCVSEEKTNVAGFSQKKTLSFNRFTLHCAQHYYAWAQQQRDSQYTKMHFDILNHVAVAHECERQRDGYTEMA